MNAIDKSAGVAAIDLADPYLLIAALASRGDDGGLLEEAAGAAMRGQDRKAEDLPTELRARLRVRVMQHLASGQRTPLAPRDPAWRAIIDFAAGANVPDEYVEMLMEEACHWPRRFHQPDQSAVSANAELPHVAIIGAGLSGIAVGVYLRRAGIPFVIYEKNDGPGGTWQDNRYPGCGVDTWSHVYSYSFALNPGWRRYYSKQGDVLDYAETCIERFGLRANIRYGCTVSAASYDEAARRWRLRVEANGKTEEITAELVVSAVGQLNVPSRPNIPGLDDFRGEIMHTARWRPETVLAGKRVALIGSAASAVQVGPTIAPDVSRLTVFQRSPQWLAVRPIYHKPVNPGDQWAFANMPGYINWHRLWLYWQFGDRLYPTLMLEEGADGLKPSAQSDELRRFLTDHIHAKLAGRPDLIAASVPDYPPMAKRIPVEFGWYDMLLRDNVELVTDAIDHVEADAVVTKDGRRHQVDAIVLATGFQATRMLQTVPARGRGGVALSEAWAGDDPRAYLGMLVPGFPNFFVMYGPNTNLGHGGSLIFQIECQARYVASAIAHLAARQAGEIEVRAEVCDAYNEQVDRLLERTVWNLPGVNNWFKNSRGRITTNSPWRLVDYWRMTRRFDPADCHIA